MFGDQARVIASITMRATMGRKRALLFAIPPAILLLVTVLLKLSHPNLASWPSQVVGIFGFTVVLPLTALIIGTTVLGAKVDEGSRRQSGVRPLQSDRPTVRLARRAQR